MTNLNSKLRVAARVFLGLLFLVEGFEKLGNVDGFAGYMALSLIHISEPTRPY